MAISEITLDGSQSQTLAGLADAMIPAHGVESYCPRL